MSPYKKATSWKVFILTVLLIKFASCDEYMPNDNYEQRTKDHMNGYLLRLIKNTNTNPERAYHLMEANLELRKSLDKIMNQRRKQLTYENFWELRRG